MQRGYRRAFASPEEEGKVEAESAAFTQQLKEKGAKYWSKRDKKK